MKTNKEFPNGFTSWVETYHEVVAFLEEMNNAGNKEDDANPVEKFYDQTGKGGLYELAVQYTDEFEEKNKGREWDGEFFDEIEEFLRIKILKLT